MLGRISRTMIRMLRVPSVRDAITKSRSDQTIVWARVTRAIVGMVRSDRATVAQNVWAVGEDLPGGARNAISVSRSTRPGMASRMLSTAAIAPSSDRR